jgi:hypothetical protein
MAAFGDGPARGGGLISPPAPQSIACGESSGTPGESTKIRRGGAAECHKNDISALKGLETAAAKWKQHISHI